MIKFFRRIRQKLLDNGNLKKYFFYAIGEIILVVIGILIALQINNWNNQRISSSQEIALLKEMKKNLEKDIIDVRGNIGWLKGFLNSNQLMLNSLEPPNTFNDTLEAHYAGIYSTAGFMKNTSAYTNLESMGFNIIRNDSLRIEITNLYTILYNGIDNTGELHRFFLQNHYFPQIMENIKIDTYFEKAYPIDHESLSKNHKFKELANYNCALLNVMINGYSNAEKEITSLINLIDKEINNRN